MATLSAIDARKKMRAERSDPPTLRRSRDGKKPSQTSETIDVSSCELEILNGPPSDARREDLSDAGWLRLDQSFLATIAGSCGLLVIAVFTIMVTGGAPEADHPAEHERPLVADAAPPQAVGGAPSKVDSASASGTPKSAVLSDSKTPPNTVSTNRATVTRSTKKRASVASARAAMQMRAQKTRNAKRPAAPTQVLNTRVSQRKVPSHRLASR